MENTKIKDNESMRHGYAILAGVPVPDTYQVRVHIGYTGYALIREKNFNAMHTVND